MTTVRLTEFISNYLNQIEITFAHKITATQIVSLPELKDAKFNSIEKALSRWRKRHPIEAVEKENYSDKTDKKLTDTDNQNDTEVDHKAELKAQIRQEIKDEIAAKQTPWLITEEYVDQYLFMLSRINDPSPTIAGQMISLLDKRRAIEIVKKEVDDVKANGEVKKRVNTMFEPTDTYPLTEVSE